MYLLVVFVLAICVIALLYWFMKLNNEVFELRGLVRARTNSFNEALHKIDVLKIRINNRDKLINDYQKEHEILLAKLDDKDNNIEFLYNNLSKQKKELVRPGNQN